MLKALLKDLRFKPITSVTLYSLCVRTVNRPTERIKPSRHCFILASAKDDAPRWECFLHHSLLSLRCQIDKHSLRSFVAAR